jgi:hypothetical protein
MKLHVFGAATVLAATLSAGTIPADAQPAAATSVVAQLRHELLQLPSYGVYDFLSFAYDRGTVTLTGYANEPH